MAHAIIPPGDIVEFKSLTEIDVPNELDKAQFYIPDVLKVLTQNLDSDQGSGIIPDESILGVTVAAMEAGTKKTSLVLLAVTKLDPATGSWTERKDKEGDIVALSCPDYNETDTLVVIP